MQCLLKMIQDPKLVTYCCIGYIILYYIISFAGINAMNKNRIKSLLYKNKPLDIITSVVWIFIAIILIASLVEICIREVIPLTFLVIYYFLFIFLFAFCYGILEWHFPKSMMEGVSSSNIEAEFQYLFVSIQTQTTLGYTRAKPNNIITEGISCIQSLLGLFFCIVFIARAVNLLR